jgi:murein L,D-transpeptidase YcbB/YkuD
MQNYKEKRMFGKKKKKEEIVVPAKPKVQAPKKPSKKDFELLASKGFKIDTDANTESSIKFFQKTNGLKVTGTLNKATLDKLKD